MVLGGTSGERAKSDSGKACVKALKKKYKVLTLTQS